MEFIGGYDGSYSRRNSILEFKLDTEQWQDIGTMDQGRSRHAVSVVSYRDYAPWCTSTTKSSPNKTSTETSTTTTKPSQITTAGNITLIGGNKTNEGNVLINGHPIW